MEHISYAKRGRVAYVTIRRPHVLNALHPPAARELAAAWEDFGADDDCWVAVLTGEGERAFSAGNDLKFAAEQSRLPPDERDRFVRGPHGVEGLMSRFDLFKPIVARVNGLALGGGFEMALACDIIVAADDVRFGLPEPMVGLVAGGNGVHRLARQAPLKRAMGWMLTGRHFSAQEAFAAGLVTELVPRAELDAAVDRWVAGILRCAPLSVRATKEMAMRGLETSLPGAEAGTYTWMERMRRSVDSLEGPRAFAEKRTPQWKGTWGEEPVL